jgi:FixJ family two-component response regulator
MVTQQKTRVIAIVDDDESLRDALKGLMKEAGFFAEAFATAEEFLHAGKRERIACLIADIRMPGMSGLELQAKLNQEHWKIPTVFITAHGDEKIRLQALRGGGRGIFAEAL